MCDLSDIDFEDLVAEVGKRLGREAFLSIVNRCYVTGKTSNIAETAASEMTNQIEAWLKANDVMLHVRVRATDEYCALMKLAFYQPLT